MKSRARTRRFAPAVDLLDPRRLPSGGVSASLSHAVLSVQGRRLRPRSRWTSCPRRAGHGPGRTVVVEGVAQFPGDPGPEDPDHGSRGRSHQRGPPRAALADSGDGQQRRVHVTRAELRRLLLARNPSATSCVRAKHRLRRTMSALEQGVVDLTNQAREQNGLPPLAGEQRAGRVRTDPVEPTWRS